jgi:glycerol-3-phosphate dehydrogenase
VHYNALERLTPGAPDLWAQVYHAVREEWALSAEDVIYRRTTLGLRGFDTPEIRERISTVLEAEAQIPPP